MNRGQFKDSACHMCLAGAVVASRFVTQQMTQQMAVSSPFSVMKYILSLNSSNSTNHLGKTQIIRDKSNKPTGCNSFCTDH